MTTPGRRALLIAVRNSECGERPESAAQGGRACLRGLAETSDPALPGAGAPRSRGSGHPLPPPTPPQPGWSSGLLGNPCPRGHLLACLSSPVVTVTQATSLSDGGGALPSPRGLFALLQVLDAPRNHTQPLGASLHPGPSSWAPPALRRPCLRSVTSSPLHSPNLKNKTSRLGLSRPRPRRGCWRPSSDRLSLDSTRGVTRPPPPGAQLPAQAPWPGTGRGKRSHGSHPSPPPHLPWVRPP